MNFERCLGCPGGECPAALFFEALENGAMERADVHRGKLSEYPALFVARALEGSIEVHCGSVSCGFGAKAMIVFSD